MPFEDWHYCDAAEELFVVHNKNGIPNLKPIHSHRGSDNILAKFSDRDKQCIH